MIYGGRETGKNRDYTFYSNRHKSWSRIVMIWASKELELLAQKIEIMTANISDHNLLSWQIKDLEKTRRWIINEDKK